MDLIRKMLARNPEQRISSADALNHPAFTIVLSQSPLSIRSVFDNKELVQFTNLTGQYHQKQINTKKTNKKYEGVPDKIEDMSPTPTSPSKKNKDTDNVQLSGNSKMTGLPLDAPPNLNSSKNIFGAK